MKSMMPMFLLTVMLFACGRPSPEAESSDDVKSEEALISAEISEADGSAEADLQGLPPGAVKLSARVAAVYVTVEDATKMAESDLWAEAFRRFEKPLRFSPLKVTVGDDLGVGSENGVTVEAYFGTF